MKSIKQPFFYYKRYKSKKENLEEYNTLFKIKLLSMLYKNSFTSKKLDLFDRYLLTKKNKNGKFSFDKKFKLKNENIEAYKDIQLCKIDYFEAIEIDDFHKYVDKIISKFSNDDKLFRSTNDRKQLKDKLQNVKKNLDSISWGSLFYINYEKHREKDNDLISNVSIGYIKTNESYFIIQIRISFSKKFKDLFAQIIDSEDVSLSKQHYHSYLNILKLRRFHSYESISMSSKCINIENLLSDVNFQVKENITKHFIGYFHKKNTNISLPTIEYYEVEDLKLFHNDSSLKQNFNTGFEGHYAIEDNQIEIYFSNNDKRLSRLQVVKQKGHGKRKQSGKDHTDYDYMETHYLLNSLAFPCVFRGILTELFDKLNNLKRDIYDFGNDTKKINIFKSLFFIKYNSSYLELKQTLVKILITTKRFEKEFNKDNLALYTSEYDLKDFTPRNYRRKQEKHNLLHDLIEDFSAQIKDLKNKTAAINEIFKSIEELNTYRTNYFLQIISLFIAILAFIFTFNKVKDFFYNLLSYISV